MTGLPDTLRVALVHDYLNQMGGAEQVLEVFHTLFPSAPIFVSVFDRKVMPPAFRDMDIRTSFMQRISPRTSVAYKLLPLFPLAFERFDLREYDLVLSSTTTFAKGVLTRPHTCHVCYCNTPFRYLWMYQEYVENQRVSRPVEALLSALATPLRVWDFAAAQRVDYFLAGSRNAARRIKKFYRRESSVLHSPVDVQSMPLGRNSGEYYLLAGRHQAYKRMDLAIAACNTLHLPLIVTNEGPETARLKALAGPTVQFTGRLTHSELRQVFAGARALLWPGEEDYGIAPVEAMGAGRPVIAIKRGGVCETVIAGQTGVFFEKQTVESLVEALRNFEMLSFDPQRIRAHAMQFDESVFKQRLLALLGDLWDAHTEQLHSGSLLGAPLNSLD
ncbi:MAG: glycosyltransferase [Chloroflexi bacterium]|nr:glycosyltransferase [Chloroflexota bacterium]